MSPTFPSGDPDGRAPTDLPVPVIRAQTETDMFGVLLGGTRQDDATNFRYYELAGVAHNVVHKDIEAIPAGVFGPFPIFLEDVCEFPMNTSGDGPVFGAYLYNAMWENMEAQVRSGIEPPHGNLIETDPAGVARDAFGVHLDPTNLINSPRRYYDTGAVIRECVEKLGPHIVACHAKDAGLDLTDAIVKLSEVPIGTGNLDYATYLECIDSLGRDVPLMLEHLSTAEEYAAAGNAVRRVAGRLGVALG